ncbi:MAG: hypothetical protein AB4080_13330 [Trichodesmium sp.]
MNQNKYLGRNKEMVVRQGSVGSVGTVGSVERPPNIWRNNCSFVFLGTV